LGESNDSIAVLSETFAHQGGGIVCGYDPKTKRLAYFQPHNSPDTNKLYYNENNQLSYLLWKIKDGSGFGYLANIFLHDNYGRVSKVYFETVTNELVDTTELFEHPSDPHDSLSYDDRNNWWEFIGVVTRINVPNVIVNYRTMTMASLLK